MGLFKRNKPEPKPCPRCMQLLDPDTVVCDMCGLDLRELEPVTAGGPAETTEERLHSNH
jgi:hypothetical protein